MVKVSGHVLVRFDNWTGEVVPRKWLIIPAGKRLRSGLEVLVAWPTGPGMAPTEYLATVVQVGKPKKALEAQRDLCIKHNRWLTDDTDADNDEFCRSLADDSDEEPIANQAAVSLKRFVLNYALL